MAINFNSERLSADDNQVFYFDQLDGDALLSPDELSSLISQHQGHELMHRYNRLRKYYVGQHKILNKPRKRQGKPDTRLVVNFAKELVDNEVGYFAGTPVKFDYVDNGDSNEEIDKQINEFVNNNNLTDVVAELAKQVDIFGRSYLLMYQNEEKQTRVAPVEPRNAFVVYANTIDTKPVFGVYYTTRNKNNGVSGMLYTDKFVYNFQGTNGGAIIIDTEAATENLFKAVPIIEFYSNVERQGLYEQVIGLIDAVDEALSNKNNDIEYFSNTIMKVINAKIDQKTMDDMIDKRVIVVPSINPEKPVDINFLNKPDADTIQENFLDRAIDMIYTKSNVANFQDEVFGTASGTALEFKLQAMSTAANMKERKFKMSLSKMWRLGFTVGATLPLDPTGRQANNIQMTFKRTVPHNIQDEATTAKALQDVVSRRTAISVLSFVDDPDAELKALEDEQQEAAKRSQQMMSLADDESDSDFNKGDAGDGATER
ncbi:phage portal protein [Weissella cibaria]|uniref:phage portal protein n=1 Tax=Weissella cibaria TaxID=137591 RepID=UPI0022E6D426|nr:phage portal protein [Weissella cibaria]MDK9677278.1 phage portal protein [Weissella cibaria]